MSARARPLIALCAVAAALAVAGTIAIQGGHAAQKQRDKPPTLLWKAYPLEQRPRPRAVIQSAVHTKEVSARTASGSQSRWQLENLLLVSMLIATFLAVATIVLLRGSVPVRVGGSLRSRARAPSPRPARGPKPRKTRPGRRVRPPIREVTAEIVAEPEAPPADAAGRRPEPDLLEVLRPKRHVERTAAAAAEAMQAEPEPSSEQLLELQWRKLIEQEHAVPVAALPELERQIEAVDERIETPPAQAPEPDAGQVSLARCEIRLWRGFIKCQLYATLGGSEGAFALSPYFRLDDDLAPNEQAQQALVALIAELEQGGWTVVSEGRPWYRFTLELS